MSSGDRGSITVLLAGAIFSVLVLGIVIAAVGQVLAARFEASTAADAAALAAAPATFNGGDAREEAVRLAEANGARLLSCHCTNDQTWAPRTVETVVEVSVDVLGLGRRTVRAKGRAEYVPLGAGG